MHQGPASTLERLTCGRARGGSEGAQVQREGTCEETFKLHWGFRLCLRGAEKPLKHSEQRISDGTCISERSCSISRENLNQEGSIGNWQGGCLEETK